MTHAPYKEGRGSARDCLTLECPDGRGVEGIEFEGTDATSSNTSNNANNNGPTVVRGCTRASPMLPRIH